MTAGDAERLVALHKLLDAHPEASVATLASTGVFAAHPDRLDLHGHSHMPAHNPMELFVPEDHVAVITVFQRALIDGMSSAPVRLVAGAAGEGIVTAELHNVDLLASHGVVVAVLVPTETSDGEGRSPLLPPLMSRPRIARLIKNGAGGVVSVDDNTVAMFGYTRDELLSMPPLVLVHPDDHQSAIGTWMEMLQYPDLARRGQLRYRCADGTWLWLEVTNTNRLDDPDYSCVFTDIVDISAEMSAQEELTRRERLLHQIAESLPLGLMQVDLEGTVCYTNERLLELLGRPAGVLLAQYLSCLRPQHRRRLLTLADEVTTGSAEGDMEVELLPGPAPDDGRSSTRLLHVGMRALTQGGEGTDGIIITVSDVTDAVRMRQALEQRASFDVLTDCLNRAELMRRLESALTRATLGTAVVFVDMDGLKGVNDTLGHRAGDEVLRQLAERLLVERRAKQMVGRLGGDEFLVVLPAVPDAQTAEAIGERIARQVHGVLSLSDGALVQLQCSVGVSWVAAGTAGSTTLVAEADAAMYVSKKAGRGEAVSFRTLPSPRVAASPTPAA